MLLVAEVMQVVASVTNLPAVGSNLQSELDVIATLACCRTVVGTVGAVIERRKYALQHNQQLIMS